MIKKLQIIKQENELMEKLAAKDKELIEKVEAKEKEMSKMMEEKSAELDAALGKLKEVWFRLDIFFLCFLLCRLY